MWRAIASNALTLFIVILIGCGIAIAIAQNSYTGEGPLAETACISVPRGGSLREVSDRFQENGVVSNSMLMRLGAEYEDKAGNLKAGNFLVPPGASMQEVVELITASGRSTCGSDINVRIGVADLQVRLRELDPSTGDFKILAEYRPESAVPPEEVKAILDGGFPRTRVTVAEGATSWQVVDGLNKAPFLSGNVDEIPAEGSLAPGSFEVTPGVSRQELLKRMSSEQSTILAAAWAARAPDLPISTPEEALVLASIIEKETAVAEERPWVSSVFVNRLNQGMRLQTDPTVIYGITAGQGTLGRGLRRSELVRPTPWNTYTIDGLPPTPIANPGREAILAAVNPASTEYLFFVANGEGGHVFAATLAEHNVNVQRWRRIEQQRSTQN